MYESIKEWINLHVSIKPCVGRSGTGTKQFGTVVDTVCYAAGELKVVRDATGSEVTSGTQLYFDGSEVIGPLDVITFDGSERPIISISTFYRNGVADIKVVYLS